VAVAGSSLPFTHCVAELHLQAVAPGLVAAATGAEYSTVVCASWTTVPLKGTLMGTRGVSGADSCLKL